MCRDYADITLEIRIMTSADISAVYAMDQDVFSADAWPLEWFSEAVKDSFAHYFLAYWGGELAGYSGMYHNTSRTPNYCKITTLGVKGKFRRRGIGKALMLKMLGTAKELCLDRAKLEVSTINPAIKLYEALGFAIEEKIENYYEGSGNSAYIMWRYE